MSEQLLVAEGLTKHWPVYRGALRRVSLGSVKAVDGISFAVDKGTGFGLVGESGCGKTTVAKLLLRIDKPTAGTVRFRGADVNRLRGGQLSQYRRRVSTVFQDPFSSLDSRMKVGGIVAEPLIISGGLSRARVSERVAQMIQLVGLPSTAVRLYPHQFSGGQRQRIAIARALSTEPEVLVLDEPTSALDVSTRAQILNLLKDLQGRLGLTLFIISHDLPLVRFISNRIAVMYLGEIVEEGSGPQVCDSPMHPYTRMLISAVPEVPKPEVAKQVHPAGEVPSAMNPPAGCRFHPRCPFAFDRCRTERPLLQRVADGQSVACHLYDLQSERKAADGSEATVAPIAQQGHGRGGQR